MWKINNAVNLKHQSRWVSKISIYAEIPEDNGNGDGEEVAEKYELEEEEEEDEVEEAAEEEDQGVGESDGGVEVPPEEDEGRDSGRYYEEEETEAETEAECEPDAGDTLCFTQDTDFNETENEFGKQGEEADAQPATMPEVKQGMYVFIYLFWLVLQ